MEEGVTTHYITYMVYRGQRVHQARALGVDPAGGGGGGTCPKFEYRL